MARFADLAVLAVSLPVFLLAELPMVGYAVCAAAWIAASAMQLAADRHVKRSLARGNRNSALGTLAAATLGRVWLVALAILLVGLSDRDAGLAAAVLAAALVTVHLAGMAIGRLISSDEEAAVSARRSMRAPSIGRSPTARRQAGGRDVGGGGRGI